MTSPLKVLAKGVADEVMGALIRSGKRRILGIGLMVFFCLAGLSGPVFIAVGVYLSLCKSFEPWLSGLIVGGIIILLCLVCALGAVAYIRRGRVYSEEDTHGPPEQKTQVENAAYLGEIIGAHLSQRGIRATDVVIAALAAGTVLSAGPALRGRSRRRKVDYPGPSQFETQRQRRRR